MYHLVTVVGSVSVGIRSGYTPLTLVPPFSTAELRQIASSTHKAVIDRLRSDRNPARSTRFQCWMLFSALLTCLAPSSNSALALG